MTTANEAYKKAVNSPAAREAAETAKSLGEEVSDFASDVARQAGKQFDRAKDAASDVYDEVHAASKDYPHVTIALAGVLGFLLGVAFSRR